MEPDSGVSTARDEADDEGIGPLQSTPRKKRPQPFTSTPIAGSVVPPLGEGIGMSFDESFSGSKASTNLINREFVDQLQVVRGVIGIQKEQRELKKTMDNTLNESMAKEREFEHQLEEKDRVIEELRSEIRAKDEALNAALKVQTVVDVDVPIVIQPDTDNPQRPVSAKKLEEDVESKQLSEELAKAKSKIEELTIKHKLAQELIDSNAKKIAGLVMDLQSKNKELDDRRQEILRLEGDLEQKSNALQRDIDRLRSKRNEHCAEANSLKQQLEDSGKEKETLKKELNSLKQELRRLREQNANHLKIEAKMMEEAEELRGDQNVHSFKLSSLTADVERLAKRERDLEDELELARGQRNSEDLDAHKKTEEFKATSEECRRLSAEVEQSRKVIAELESKLASQFEFIRQKTDEIASLQNRFDELQAMKDNLIAENSSVNESARDLNGQVVRLQRRIESLAEEIRTISDEKTTLQLKTEDLSKENKKLNDTLIRLPDLESLNAQMSTELNYLRQELNKRPAPIEIAALKAELDRKVEESEDLSEKLEELKLSEKEWRAVASKVDSLKDVIATKEEQILALIRAEKELKAENDTKSRQIAGLVDESRRVQEELNHQCIGLRNENGLLHERLMELETYPGKSMVEARPLPTPVQERFDPANLIEELKKASETVQNGDNGRLTTSIVENLIRCLTQWKDDPDDKEIARYANRLVTTIGRNCQRAIAFMDEKLIDALNRADVLQDKTRSLSQQVESYDSNNRRLDTQIRTLQKNKHQLENKCAELNQQLRSAMSDAALLQQTLDQKTHEHGLLMEKLAEAICNEEENQEMEEALHQRLREAQELAEERGRKILQVEERLMDIEHEKRTMYGESEKLKQTLRQVTKRSKETEEQAKAQIQALEDKLQRHAKSREFNLETMQMLIEDCKRMQGRIQYLRYRNSVRDKVIRTTANQLTAVKEAIAAGKFNQIAPSIRKIDETREKLDSGAEDERNQEIECTVRQARFDQKMKQRQTSMVVEATDRAQEAGRDKENLRPSTGQ